MSSGQADIIVIANVMTAIGVLAIYFMLVFGKFGK